jgi:outer membrane protein TolC
MGLVRLVAACAAPGHARFEDVVPLPSRNEAPAESVEADEASLAERPTLAAIMRVALARNPELSAAKARTEAAFAHVPGAGRLPDLQLKTELWGAPLTRPWAVYDADTIMIGVRQEFPAPGVRAADSRAAEEDARAAAEAWRTTELDVIRDVQEAWAAYELADRALAIHRDQINVAGQLVDQAGTLVSTGRVTQDDVLKLDLERSRLHRDVAQLERDQRAAAVKLNALMGREPRAPLGAPPAEEPPPPPLPPIATLERLALEHRPELAAADHRIRARRAEVDSRRKQASWPSLMVGADYWLMPEATETHGYGLMLSINLPWLNGRRDDDTRAAEAEARATEREAEAMRTQILAEVGAAYADVEAAARELEIVEKDLLPRAVRGFDSARSTFGTGGGSTLAVLDAMRSLLDVKIEQAHALIDLRMAWATLERAAGTSLAEVMP